MLPPPKDPDFDIEYDREKYLNPDEEFEDEDLLASGAWEDDDEEDDEEAYNDALFIESDHPRGPDGKFIAGAGGGAIQEPKPVAPIVAQQTGKSLELPKAPQADPYIKGGKDKHGFERSSGLIPEHRKIEQQFYDAIRLNKDVLINSYWEGRKDEAFPKTIDADEVKKLNPDFAKNPNLAGAVHEPSSYMSKVLFTEALKDKKRKGDKSPTLFTAGGSGSGKGATTTVAAKSLGVDDPLIFDSVMGSAGSASKKIDEALEITDGDAAIVYTNTPVERAVILNALRNRSVSIDVLLNAHIGASNTVRELQEKYKDNSRVKFKILNNFGLPNEIKEGSLDDVPKYNKEELKGKLEKIITDIYENGFEKYGFKPKEKMSEEKYKTIMGLIGKK